MFSANATVNLSLEFYRKNALICSSAVKSIGSDELFAIVPLGHNATFDEYRIIVKGSGSKTPRILELELLSFGEY